jgi:hypothetical protein
MPERSRLALAPLAACMLLVLCFFIPWRSGNHPGISKADLRLSQSGLQMAMGWGTVHMKGQRTYVDGMDRQLWAWLGVVLPVGVALVSLLHQYGLIVLKPACVTFILAGVAGLAISLAAISEGNSARQFADAWRRGEFAKLPANLPPERRRPMEVEIEKYATDGIGRCALEPTYIIWGGKIKIFDSEVRVVPGANVIGWAVVAACGILPLAMRRMRQPLPQRPAKN